MCKGADAAVMPERSAHQAQVQAEKGCGTPTLARLRALSPAYPSRSEWITALADRGVEAFPADTGHALLEQLEELWGKLGEPNTEMEEVYTTEVITSMLSPVLMPSDHFSAGQLHTRACVWERYMQLAGTDKEHAETVLDWLRHGVPLLPTTADDPHKATEPNHTKKVESVRKALLRSQIPAHTVQKMLTSDVIEPVVMDNFIPNDEDRQFIRSQIDKSVASGALKPWPFPSTRPAVVQPLFTVTNPYNKKRQVVNAIHANLHLKYTPVKYQTIKDACRMLDGQQYVYALDFRSGYHHLLLRPEVWTYFGVFFEGEVYVHAALPFGLSQAPEAFTRVVETIYQPLRQLGWPVTSMVDDALGAGYSEPNCAWRLVHHVNLLSLMGWTLSIDMDPALSKCTLAPCKVVKFLGFVIDLTSRQLFIPQKKLNRFQGLVQELKLNPAAPVLDTALGLLASFAPALRLTRAMVRLLRRAAQVGEAEPWMPTTSFWQFWGLLGKLHGCPIDAPIVAATPLQLVVDTGERATGAHIPTVPLATWKMQVMFTSQESARMAEGQFSSTARELMGIRKALQQLVDRPPQGLEVQKVALQLVNDNQGAVAALCNLRGKSETLMRAADIWKFIVDNDLQVSFVWQPRTTEEVMEADRLSKYDDPNDWRLSKGFLQAAVHERVHAHRLVMQEDLMPPWPTDIDMFASSAAHQVDAYVAEVWDGGCIAVDAWAQHWGEWPVHCQRQSQSRMQPVLFLFPPVSALSLVLHKMKRDRGTAWLVCPRQLRQVDECFIAKELQPKLRFDLTVRDVSTVVKPTHRNGAVHGGKWRSSLQAMFITFQECEFGCID
jgi:hypothetical protein